MRVGITGPPGVGKSSFIEVLGLYLIGLGHKVAVLAPYTPRYIPRPDEAEDPRGAVLYDLFSAAEARERRAVLRKLSQAAVPVLEVGPEARVGSLMARLRVLK